MSHISRLFFLAVITLVLAFYFTSAFSESQLILSLQSHPKPSQAPFTRKIVAVGDLHGDLPNALKVLQMAHVVDAEGNWSGEIDIFVQTGDIIDR
jgi:Calcineurin-like phosphoesterase